LTPSPPVDVVVIGGGPAGSSIGRLLAQWGHSVVILSRESPRARGLAESIPPSTRKLLSQIGALDAVELAGFYRTRGNTVWWASRDPRVETFGSSTEAEGYQVFRPEFDRVLLENAATAGADVRSNARVFSVAFADDEATVEYGEARDRSTIACRIVVDASGRAGIVGRRFRVPQPGHRMFALVGVWTRQDRWDLPDETHTVVETYRDGWAWSVPVSANERHVGAMVGSATPQDGNPRALADAYQAEIANTKQLAGRLGGASLQRVWACDASLYCATRFAGPRFLLAGDAGSFIDPLSSFGVKKALASAWLGAIVVHTRLAHADRETLASDFFSDWERRVYATHLKRSRDFARAACAEHPSAFWTSRADVAIDAPADADDVDVAHDPDVQRAFEAFKAASRINLTLADGIRFASRPVVRGREIVAEDALADGMRFVGNVDLVTLARMAGDHHYVPDLFDAYCQRCAPVPLPNMVGGLSLLVAKGILHERR
jgi:flavin-dependent dehydrogenase